MRCGPRLKRSRKLAPSRSTPAPLDFDFKKADSIIPPPSGSVIACLGQQSVTWKELSQSVMQQKIEEEDLLDNIQVFDLVLCRFLYFDCMKLSMLGSSSKFLESSS